MEELNPTYDGIAHRWQRPGGRCSRNGCERPGHSIIKWRAYTVGDLMCEPHARTLKARFPHLIA